MKRFVLCAAAAIVLVGIAAPVQLRAESAVVGFEGLSFAPGSNHWSGTPQTTTGMKTETFTSGAATFTNYSGYDAKYDWSYWGDWAYSKAVDKTTPDYTNQYSAISGGGRNGSVGYGIAYLDGTRYTSSTGALLPPAEGASMSIAKGYRFQGMYVNNTTYGYCSMKNGSTYPSVAPLANPNGWMMLTINGYDAADGKTGFIDFYLADFRDGKQVLVKDWTWVDLSALGDAVKLKFQITESADGMISYDGGKTCYMNHPSYFAMDDLTLSAVPEPATWGSLLGVAAIGGVQFLRRRRAAAR